MATAENEESPPEGADNNNNSETTINGGTTSDAHSPEHETVAPMSSTPNTNSNPALTNAPSSGASSTAAPVSIAELRLQLEKLSSEASTTVAGISLGSGLAGWFGSGASSSSNGADNDDAGNSGKPSTRSIRDACKAALEDIKKREEAKDPELAVEGTADRYWTPFKMACHPDQTDKLKNASLSCIQRLVSFRLLKGEPTASFPDVTAAPSPNPANAQLTPTTTSAATAASASGRVTIDEIVLAISECFEGPLTEDNLQLSILKCLLTVSTTPTVALHSNALLTAIQTAINIYSNTRNTINQATARGALTQMLNNLFGKAEGVDQTYRQLVKQQALDTSDPRLKADLETLAAQSYLLKTDIATVFKILCKLSMFSESPVAALTPEDLPPAVLRCRTIALESCLTMLRQGVTSSWFRTDPTIVSAIQRSLCLSLSRNAVVTDPALFELGISVFLLLVAGWRAALKREIEVLLVNIYLYILEMGNAAPQQKLVVLQCLSKIVAEPQVMADLYVNYDCEIGREGLFEKIVEVCGRVAQGLGANQQAADGLKGGVGGISTPSTASSQAPTGPATEEDKKLKRQGLRALVGVVESLVEWSKPVAVMAATGTTPGGTVTMTPVTAGGRNEPAASFDEPRPSVDSTGTSGTGAGERGTGHPVLLLKNPLDAITKDVDIPYIYPVGKGDGGQDDSGDAGADGANGGSSSGGKGVSSSSAEPLPEEVASRKQLLRQLVTLFNSKPKKAIKEFVDNQFVPADDPAALVAFIRGNPMIGLTKSSIGELLGEGDPESIKIMHAWIDSMDFAGLAFVDALRSFLQTFRLPGEAQKIDRIMEKFADRFLECNPDSFASADTAYTLAYSVIMLNVDQHSVKVKNKMDKAAFIKNNRGINSGSDLPEALLSSIFDDISGNEIVLEEERADIERAKNEKAADERERNDMYKREMAHMQKKSQALMMQKSPGGTGGAGAGAKGGRSTLLATSSSTMSKVAEEGQLPFRPATNPDLARSMFKTACWPFLAAFSLMFENDLDDSGGASAKFDQQISDIVGGNGKSRSVTDKISPVSLSLRGMAGCVRISGIFRMEMERNAFVSSLAKMTCLSKVAEMKPRNIKAVKTLIILAGVLGEYLDSSWLDVLKCVSLLERTQLIEARAAFPTGGDMEASGSGGSEKRSSSSQPSLLQSIFEADDDSFSDSGSSPRRSSSAVGANKSFAASPAVVMPLDQAKAAGLEQLVKQIQGQDIIVAIDRIFSNTVQLSGLAVQAFFRSLCEVSAEEVGITDSNVPQTPTGNGPPGSKLQSQPPILISATPSSSSLSSLVSTGSGSRMYSLQKVVEVAYYNMFRIRYEFSAIWRILQPHFNIMGCHPDPIVATFAVDALRQLSMKFLERDELSHYNTQSDFLRSFEQIMRNSANLTIKDLIIQSFKQMIAAKAKNIRSGWKSIWSVLSRAAHETHPALVKNAFGVAQLVYQDAVETVVSSGGFAEYIACLKEFAQAGQRATETTGSKPRKPVGEEVIIGSIRLLQGCAAKLLELGPAAKVSTAAAAGMGLVRRESVIVLREQTADGYFQPVEELQISPEDAHQHQQQQQVSQGPGASEEQFYLMWFPILSSLSRVVIDHNSPVVRGEATEALFAVLKQSGHLFDMSMWRNIRRSVIWPIFEGLNASPEDDQDDEEGGADKPRQGGPLAQCAAAPTSEEAAMWVQALRELVDLASALFLKLPEPLELVRSVLDLVVPMIGRRNENLASTGAICLQRFLKDIAPRLSERQGAWELVTDALERAFDVSTPRDLLFWQYKEPTPASKPVPPIPEEPKEQSVVLSVETVPPPAAVEGNVDSELAQVMSPTAETPSGDRTSFGDVPRTATPRSPARKPMLSKRKPTLVMDFDAVIVRAAVHLELIQSARDAALVENVSPSTRVGSSATNLGESNRGGGDDDAQSTVSTTASGNGAREAASSAAGPGAAGSLPQCAALATAPVGVRNRWLQLFRDSYLFAYAFNQDLERRTAIFRKGFVPQLPNLSKQEVVSCASLIRTMFAIYLHDGDASPLVEMSAEPSWLAEARAAGVSVDHLPTATDSPIFGAEAGSGDMNLVQAEIVTCLTSLISSVLVRFVEQAKDQRKHGKELSQWTPLVASVYRDLAVFLESHRRSGSLTEGAAAGDHGGDSGHGTTVDRYLGLRRQVAGYFKLGIQLIHVDKAEVRWALERFMESISSLISLV